MTDISIEMAFCMNQIREGLRVLRSSFEREGYSREKVEAKIFQVLFDSDHVFAVDYYDGHHVDQDDRITQTIVLICSHYEQSGNTLTIKKRTHIL